MRDISLLEQKKLQWAKEKEELSKLNDFFSATTTTHQIERTSIRTYYSNVDLSSSTTSSVKSSTMPRRANYYYEPYDVFNNFHKNNKNDPRHSNYRSSYAVDPCCDSDTPYQASENNHDINHGSSARAPMLPPIGRNNRQKQMSTQTHQNHFVQPNTDEETSGYLSDRMSPLMWNEMQQRQHPHLHQRQHQSHQKPSLPKDYSNYIYPSSGDELAPDVDAMKIEERRRLPKHKPPPAREADDNGHETDFSIPKTPSSMCSDNRNYSRLSSCQQSFSRKDKEERAKWGDRNNHFYDTVSKDSSVKSADGPCWLERGFVDSGDESVRSYSFIRGQNAPIDPNILAERTSKRIKALELQNAIKAQVEERERLRKLELEQSLLEERRQEESLRQQMESNEQRHKEEQRKIREKLEREQQRQEMMRIAIEKARQEAEVERKKKRSACITTADCADDEKIEYIPEHERENMNITNQETSTSPTFPQPNIDKDIDGDDDDDDDGEQILIGTPIKMRKKTLNKTYKVPVSAKKEVSVQSEKEPTVTTAETNVDGIALVLQTLPPIMPILNNDIINLNQNINNLNTSNIQLAVMLAHQMQQLNSIAQSQTQSQSSNLNPNTNQMPSGDPANNKTTVQETNSSEEQQPASSTRIDAENSASNDICKQCTTGSSQRSSLNEDERVATKDQTQTKDAATVTDDFGAISNGIDHSKEMTEEKAKNELTNVTDASTQTDKKLEYCFQCRYHHCHHHHVIVKELSSNCTEDVKTVAVNHSSKLKCLDKECASASVGGRNMCADPKEPAKIEDRPKWGVNRPLHQYVKASERDPFYLRNKRKKHQKRQYTEENSRSCDADGSKEESMPGSRSTSPSPSIITNSTITLSSPQLKNRKRSICTEILPIKTDMNGRVYLNFNEASLQVTEDEQRPSSKQRPLKRIMNRSQTANDIRSINTDTIDRNHTEELID